MIVFKYSSIFNVLQYCMFVRINVWNSFTEKLCIMFGTDLQNKYASCFIYHVCTHSPMNYASCLIRFYRKFILHVWNPFTEEFCIIFVLKYRTLINHAWYSFFYKIIMYHV